MGSCTGIPGPPIELPISVPLQPPRSKAKEISLLDLDDCEWLPGISEWPWWWCWETEPGALTPVQSGLHGTAELGQGWVWWAVFVPRGWLWDRQLVPVWLCTGTAYTVVSIPKELCHWLSLCGSPHGTVPPGLSLHGHPHMAITMGLSPYGCPHVVVPMELCHWVGPYVVVPMGLCHHGCPHKAVPMWLFPWSCATRAVPTPLSP